MIDEIYVYPCDLPPGINEMVVPCADGYTVYVSTDLDRVGRLKAYRHALKHIEKKDFEKEDVHRIEIEAHREELK